MSLSKRSLGKLTFLFALVFAVLPVWGESVTAPVNHVVDEFEDSSAQSDTLYAESNRTIKPTGAVKAHGAESSRITVNETEGSGVVHVADITDREGDDEGNCLFLVSGIYIPDPTSNDSGGTGDPSDWYTGYENGDMEGTLTLVDLISTRSESDTGDWDSDPQLYCGTDSDGKGHVEFMLNVDSGSYGWTITESGTLDADNRWSDSLSGLDPGQHTLEVNGDYAFQREIVFKVINAEVYHPNDSQQIVFNDSIPGEVSLECQALSSGGNDDRLTWYCDLPGENWDPPVSGLEGGKTAQATMTYTGLPGINDLFGDREIDLVYYWDDGSGGRGSYPIDSDSETVKLFYPPTAKNHPDPGQGVSCNFFYYYQQTPAGCDHAVFVENLGAKGKTTLYRNNDGLIDDAPEEIKIGRTAFEAETIGPYLDGAMCRDGIDAYRLTVAHENQHYEDYNEGEGAYDYDNDGIVWHLEDRNYDGIWQWWMRETWYQEVDDWDGDPKTSFHKIVTDVDGKSVSSVISAVDDDGEWRAYQAELDVQMEKYDEHDWAKGGSNWDW